MPRPDAAPSRSPAAFAAVLLLLAGTAFLFLVLKNSPAPPAPDSPPAPEILRSVYGRSMEGRELEVFSFGTGKGPPLLIMASIHGSEGAGTPLATRLLSWLRDHPAAGEKSRILVIPAANPDGLETGRRFNSRGVDLNRNFPAGNREDKARFGLTALSEPESQALHDLILREPPAVIVSIHQPLFCVDYDGPAPAAALAEKLGRLTGLPVKKLGARPGSLGAWFGETLRRPILTLELPRTLTPDPDQLWRTYGPGLTDLILHPETWTTPPPAP